MSLTVPPDALARIGMLDQLSSPVGSRASSTEADEDKSDESESQSSD